ncbi:MAG TPA: hypothetical protein VI685_25140 [Candidatus Angelobacter sp.]
MKCLVAVFGDPQQPNKSLVESGQYDPDPRYAPFPSEPGDLMLLYCTSSYQGRPMQIAGIGVVLSTDSTWVKYRWLPFKDAIPKSRIDAGFEPIDLQKFGNIRFSSHWFFQISLKSFSDTVADQEIDWKNI